MDTGERAGDDDHDGADENRQPLSGKAFGPRIHAGAKHRRPERHQGAGDGEAEPAEDHHHGVGDEQAAAQVVIGPAGQEGAEGRAEGHAGRCGQVVVDGGAEAHGNGGAQASPQHDAVPDDGARDQDGAGDGEHPALGNDAREHQGNSGEKQCESAALRSPDIDCRAGLEEGLGEVGAPHDGRMREGTEQHEVDEQPIRVWH